MSRIYLAGKMSGVPFFNFPAFNEYTAAYRKMGHEVFNPAEEDIKRHGGVDISIGNDKGDPAIAAAVHGFSLKDALSDDTQWIIHHADTIAMMPGWEDSKGARAEWHLAIALGHTVLYL